MRKILSELLKFVLPAMSIVLLPTIAFPVHSAEVIILGDTKLKPVSYLIREINETLPYETSVSPPRDINGDLTELVRSEGAKAVVALGRDALEVSLSLPESIPVIYGLTVDPLETERRNVTGVYMATPVEEYISFINTYFPKIRRIGMICEPASREAALTVRKPVKAVTYGASNPYEFIKGIKQIGRNIDAFLLLPERDLISGRAIEELYLYSFREKIPVVGISEKHVKIGSLFSLVFDMEYMGRQMGEVVKTALSRGGADFPPSPPDRFKLYINRRTADMMDINIPRELLERAEKVYSE